MSIRRKNLTFLPAVTQKAEEIMAKTGDPSFSALCVRLINEEHDRRVDREGWLVEMISELTGQAPNEVRRMIDAGLERLAGEGGGKAKVVRAKRKKLHP